MKKRLMIFVAIIVVAVGGWLFYRRSQTTNAGSNADSVTTASTSLQTDSDLSGDHDVLVVYFSRTEGVWNGPLEIGNTQSQLESQFPNATVLDGFSVRGSNAADAQDDVTDWLEDIGVTN